MFLTRSGQFAFRAGCILVKKPSAGDILQPVAEM
jgi:hypothetical protein